MAGKSEPHLGDLYREVILDHYRKPHGRDAIAGANRRGEGLNPTCGDECEIALRVEGDRVAAVHVGGRGCSISVASGSMLAQVLPGRSVHEAERLIEGVRQMMHGQELPADLETGDLDVLAGLKDFPVRVKCALLAWTTLATTLKGDARPATTEGAADPAPISPPHPEVSA